LCVCLSCESYKDGEKMKITFIQAGGTIDKEYAEKAGVYNFEINEPASKRVLKRARPNFEYDIVSVLKKDSLDMDDSDRQKVYDACVKTESDKIVITHGTDTMVNTAEKLGDIKDKTIVIVGASQPEKFMDSDAQFNIGVAVGAINVLEKGIYIAMSGRIYKPDEVQKQKDTGQFVEK